MSAKLKAPKEAIAHIDDFRDDSGNVNYDDPKLAGKHICGASGFVFENEEDYLNHTSPVTGFTPRDLEHQDALTGGRASKASEAAIARGEERKEKE